MAEALHDPPIKADPTLVRQLDELLSGLRAAWSVATPGATEPDQPGGLLRAIDNPSITAEVLTFTARAEGAAIGRHGYLVRPPEAPTASLARLGEQVSSGLFKCPYGSSPSQVDWRYVPVPKDYMELRCLHGPPSHCFSYADSHYIHVPCE